MRDVSSRNLCRLATAPVNDVSSRLDVSALVVDTSVRDDGADDRVARNCDALRALNEAFQCDPQIAPALFPEADRVSVTVDGLTVVKFMLFGNIGGTAPMQKIFFDDGAIWMAADRAAAPMPAQARFASAGRRRGSGAFPIFLFSGHIVLFRLARSWS